VATDDYENMMTALKAITKRVNIHIFLYDAPLYLSLFKKRLVEKESDGSELWLDDIQAVAGTVKSEIEKIEESMSCIILNAYLIRYTLSYIICHKRYNVF